MDFFLMLLVTVMVPTWYILPSRIISMTFNSFSKSITIKNDKWAELLIAEKNTWGIATNSKKRNKMSLWGLIGYVVFLPQIVFMPYIGGFILRQERGNGARQQLSLTKGRYGNISKAVFKEKSNGL